MAKKSSSVKSVPVAIVMGSRSDLPTMKDAALALKEFGIAFEMRVVSAHRTPDLLHDFSHQLVDTCFLVHRMCYTVYEHGIRMPRQSAEVGYWIQYVAS